MDWKERLESLFANIMIVPRENPNLQSIRIKRESRILDKE